MSHELRSEAAGLIRKHLWNGASEKDLPPAFGKPWTMGRDLNIWNALTKHYKTEELNAAIRVARSLRPDWQDQPMTMRCFYFKIEGEWAASGFLSNCIGEAHKRGLFHVEHSKPLPGQAKDHLREVLGL